MKRIVMRRFGFLDLDGVLVDFVGAATRAHNVKVQPYTLPEHMGIFELSTIFSIGEAEFWAPLNNFNFWANLTFQPDGLEILALVEKFFGERNICILTLPSKHYECSGAKQYWIEKNLPRYARRFFIGPAKEFFSTETGSHILIDDYDKNVDAFREVGGTAILVPRPWNRLHAIKYPVPYLEQDLKRIFDAKSVR